MTVTRRRERSDEGQLTGLFSGIIGGINQSGTANITFESVDSTHVRATFSAAVLDNPAIRCLDLWLLTPTPSGVPIKVLEVVPEQTPETTSVLLTTTEHLQSGNYIGTLYFLEIA